MFSRIENLEGQKLTNISIKSCVFFFHEINLLVMYDELYDNIKDYT